MPKANPKITIQKILLLSVLSILVFIAKAFVRLPISQKNIEGNGLYNYISLFQFWELPIATYICIFLVAKYVFKFQNANSNLIALGFSLINLGLLIIDVRLHKYNFIIEQYIQSKYGSHLKIYLIAFTSICIGAVLLRLVLFMPSRKSKKAK